MLVVSAIDYTQVILGALTLIGVICNAAIAAWVTVQLRTPSGDRLGAVVERTHDMAAINAMAVRQIGHDTEQTPSVPPTSEVG